jgi:hypothetical protein
MDFRPRCTLLAPDIGVATSRNRAHYSSSSRLALGHDPRTSLTAKPICDGYDRRGLTDECLQFRNASRARHPEILPVTRAVSGTAAIVTTPLRSLVTMAASPVARRSSASVGCHLPTGVPRRRRGRPRPWLHEQGRARSSVAGVAQGLGGQLTGVFGADMRVCKPQQTGARGIPKASTSGAVLRPRRGCGWLQCNRATRRRSERLFPRRRKPPARLAPVMALA